MNQTNAVWQLSQVAFVQYPAIPKLLNQMFWPESAQRHCFKYLN